MSICNSIYTGVAFDCDQKPVGGLEQIQIYLGNRSDIDYNATVVNRDSATGKHNIDALALVAGATLFSFGGITTGKVLNASYSLQANDYLNMIQHTVNVAVYDQCEESLAMLNSFLNGADVFAVIEQKFKGVDEKCAFQIYGYHNGLQAGELAYNANENNGMVLLPLSSKEPFEPYVPYNLSIGGTYASTVTALTALV